MQTMITMKYSEKFDMTSIYAERYGIVYKEISRVGEYVFIDIPVDEYITDSNTVRIIADILNDILRAEPVDIL